MPPDESTVPGVPIDKVVASLGLARKDAQEALRLADEVLAEEPVGSVRWRDALRARGEAQFHRGDSAAAQEAFGKLVEAARSAGDRLREGFGHAGLGKTFGRLDHMGEAYRALAEARARFEEAQHDPGIAEVMNSLGSVHMNLGESAEAIACFSHGLDVARRCGREDLVSRLLNNIALVEKTGNLVALSRQHLEEAYEVSLRTGDRVSQAHALFNLAMLHLIEENPPEVRPMVDRVVELRRSTGDLWGAANDAQGAAFAEAKLGHIAEARRLWAETREWLRELGHLHQVIRTCIDEATVLLDHPDQLDAAGELIAEAERVSVGFGRHNHYVDLLKAKSDWAEKAGRYDLALAALKACREEEQRLADENTRRRLEVLAVRSQVEVAKAEAREARRRSEELEAALVEAEQQRLRAEEANRFQSDLVRTAAHDLRSPLNAVVGFLDLAMRDLQGLPVAHPARESILTARQAASGAVETLHRLLDPKLAEAGRLVIESEPVDLEALARKVAREAIPAASAKRQELKVLVEGNAWVLGDRVLLAEVLQNFVGNAIKFGPQHQRVVLRVIGTRPGIVRFEVEDQGPGFTSAEREKLFMQGSRLGNRPTGGESSHGLGLSIAAAIIQAHGGKIGAESRGRFMGSTFWFEAASVPADAGLRADGEAG